jgi:hypothetical protein
MIVANSSESEDGLQRFRWTVFVDFQKEIERRAKSGKLGSPPPVKTLFQIADWVVPLLNWLAENKPDGIKQYAPIRWAWPGYFHLLKRERRRYESLLPKYNSTGTKIIQESPIGLGGKLGLNLNYNLTKGDYLFIVAAYAVLRVTRIDVANENGFTEHWNWLRAHNKPMLKVNWNEFAAAATKYIESRGKFSRKNWRKWKPVFDSFLTYYYAPPAIKFKFLPKAWQSSLDRVQFTGTYLQWFENSAAVKKMNVVEQTKLLEDLKETAAFHHVDKPLQEEDDPAIREIVSRRKTERGKWIELKDELLKRIFNLAHPE